MSKARIDPATGLAVLVKRPTESRTYYMDFGSLLVGAALSTVTSVVSTSQGKVGGSSNVTVGTTGIDGARVTAAISGGTDGEHYKIVATVVDSAGNTLVGEGMMYVRGS